MFFSWLRGRNRRDERAAVYRQWLQAEKDDEKSLRNQLDSDLYKALGYPKFSLKPRDAVADENLAIEILEQVFRKGLFDDLLDSEIFYRAAEDGHLVLLDYLESKGVDISQGIADSGDINTLRYFLKKGVDPNTLSNAQGQTALHNTSDPEMIKLLLSYGADPLTRDDFGKTSIEKKRWDMNFWLDRANYKNISGAEKALRLGYAREYERALRLIEEAIIEPIGPNDPVHSGRPLYEPSTRHVSLYHEDEISVTDYSRPITQRAVFDPRSLPSTRGLRSRPVIKNYDATFSDEEEGMLLSFGYEYDSDYY